MVARYALQVRRPGRPDRDRLQKLLEDAGYSVDELSDKVVSPVLEAAGFSTPLNVALTKAWGREVTLEDLAAKTEAELRNLRGVQAVELSNIILVLAQRSLRPRGSPDVPFDYLVEHWFAAPKWSVHRLSYRLNRDTYWRLKAAGIGDVRQLAALSEPELEQLFDRSVVYNVTRSLMARGLL